MYIFVILMEECLNIEFSNIKLSAVLPDCSYTYLPKDFLNVCDEILFKPILYSTFQNFINELTYSLLYADSEFLLLNTNSFIFRSEEHTSELQSHHDLV